MLKLQLDPKKGIWAEEQETVEKLKFNFFGTEKDGKVWLNIEEALYLIKFQKAECKYNDKTISFSELAAYFPEPRLFVRYNAYRDWRDRGLIIKRPDKFEGIKAKTYKRYPSKPLPPKKIDAIAHWYADSMFSIIEDSEVGKELFGNGWFGQYGIYKQTRGHFLKLNFLETIFLAKHFGLKVVGLDGKKLTAQKILREVVSKREYAKQLYEVYEDWRLRGFIVKSGFKFGSHFRIYFPGVSPLSEKGYVHSKHVLHVFPKEQKLLVSEWARVVRVAHSVKKTFILGIPELRQKDYIKWREDFVAWRRKKGPGGLVRETPDIDPARYLLIALSEDEHIGGIELASLLNYANEKGLELILSITDSETAITYYVLKRIILPGSKYEYYEIEWMKP
ncbi:MAG: tRNA-intron lyase [Candidatus Aenigmatarchaeota archaeon]